MECFTSSVSDFGKDLLRRAVNEIRYPCCFNNFVEDLRKKEDNLISTRNSVEDRAKHVTKQAMKSAEVLDEWLKEAKTEINNGEELLIEARTNKKWCFGRCPNWFWRYNRGKKLAQKKVDIEKCIEEGSKYIQLERVATLPSATQHFPSEKCLEFDSRQSAYTQLMEAVKDDKVTLIGLYGMGGCGKTTLAMQVCKKAESEHLFDKVLFVPVSSTVDVGRIQDKIASSLSFPFPESEEREKARRLHTRLTQEKRTLLILDDVWERLDFGVIGIPSGKDHLGCKVLITTRSVDVCNLMDCKPKIPLSILTNEEAWTLFQKEACICEATSDTIKDLARLISEECLGLPVAIAALAATLKGKDETNWNVALHRLKNSIAVNIEEGLQNPYKCLQLSYDNLNIKEAKSLFLLCSVFPEDYEIPLEFLTRCAIGLGLVGEVHSYEVARNEVSVAKNKLNSSCLLLDVDAKVGECVKMHDLVRDVAHWIAENDKKVIKCALGVNVNVHSNSLRYLWCNEVPDQLDCSNLEFLRIGTKLEVSDEIFKGMGKLRVLILVNEQARRPLPAMLFKSLINLRYLLLHGWELSDILFEEDIKTLENLKLTSCSILEFSNVDAVIQLLTKLRLLELYKCDMKMNNFEVIGRLPRLEELYIVDERSKWDVYNENTVEFFNKFSVPQTLQSYAIKLGALHKKYDMRYFFTHRRTLLLGCYQKPNEAIKGLAKKAEVLYLAKIEGGQRNIVPDVFKGGEDISELGIRNSKEIECLVDNRNHSSELVNLFSKLVTLRIERMEHFRALWCGRLPSSDSFQKLGQLYLCGCPQLTSLFTPMIARILVQLEKLEVLECDGLKHVLADDDKSEIRSDDHNLMFSKLKWLKIEQCEQLEYVIPITFAQNLVQLEDLLIEACGELKWMFGEYMHEDQLVDQNQNELKIEFRALKNLEVRSCANLKYIIPVTSAESLVQLQSLEIHRCEKLKYIFDQCTHGDHLADQSKNCFKIDLSSLKHLEVWDCYQLEYIFPFISPRSLQQLESLNIQDCGKLKYIFKQCTDGDHQLAIESQNELRIELFALNQLEVESCNQLEYVIPVIYAQNLRQLESLSIHDCRELKYIFGQNIHENQLIDQNQNKLKIEFPAVRQLDLSELRNIISIFPENYDPSWPSLRDFTLYSCPEFDTTPVKAGLLGEKPNNTSAKDIRDIEKHFLTLETLKLRDSKLEGIFNLNGLEIIGKPVSFGLQFLYLNDLPQMTYVCAASKISLTFENLTRVVIKRCAKSEVIFPASVIRYLPELKRLEIHRCEELKEIIEEDAENHKLSNLHSPQPQPQACFPKLEMLVVQQCHKLKHLIPVSVSNDLPNLKVLIINEASELEELFRCEHAQGGEKGRMKVVLPKLKPVIFIQLPSLCQGSELQTVRHRFVQNCNPELSLTSTTTLQQLMDKIRGGGKDLELEMVARWDLKWIVYDMIESAEASIAGDIGVENPTEEAITDFPVVPESPLASGNELPSSQVIEESTKKFIGEVPASEIPATATLPTNFELIDRPSPSLMDIQQHKPHSQELVDGQSMSEPCLKNQLKPFGEIESTAEIPQSIKRGVEKGTTSDNAIIVTSSTHSESASSQSVSLDACQRKSHAHEWDSMPETTSQLQLNHEDPATSVIEQPSSQINGTNQSILSNLAGTVHEHNQIESGATASGSYEFPESEKEFKGTPHLQSLEQKLSPISLPNLTESINETETAIIGKDPASVTSIIPASGSELRRPSPTSLTAPLCKMPLHKVDREPSFLDKQHALGETISVGDTVKQIVQAGSTPEEAMKATLSAGTEGDGMSTLVVTDISATGRDIHAPEDDNSIEAPPPGDSADSHSSIIGELGAYKHLVDLDDPQIALLAELFAVHPHLRNVCQKLSERFQAWILKTLADMLLFLQNESAVSVTSQRKEEFLILCNDAVQLGIERSWVDDMRQRVMVRDTGVDHAQARLTELLKRQDQLTQELCKIKGEINSLNDFVDSKKKCFGFL
ncbi:uncharacterized protein LOC133305048 isoform X2 [Gastrolobium bilobum]|uniref:uncharacterized protein LOC133305048 isoform X2 n=1 Tax=Gastrolobium bilobum TaxID=150636 RepID=UPI002AB1577A|nr:uncharacterized protein LOC133305048 isoform X2 [Gastrolobium bilobum]